LLLALTLASALPSAAADRPATIDEFLALSGRPGVIAHRGFSGAAPENTLAAIRAAVDVGADMVEIDVTLTADGHVVVLHDETVDRTTDGSGKAADQTLAQLQRLDAGTWFSPRFGGERIPTLDAVLSEMEGRVLLNIEIKSEAVGSGIVPRVAETVRARHMVDQVIVSSFSPHALQLMRQTAPEIRTAVLFNPDFQKEMDPVEIVADLGASAFNIKRTRLTRKRLERCRQAGVPVAVYTVNTRRRLRKVLRRGVNAVFTDHPDRMLEVLQSVGGRHQPEAVAADGKLARLSDTDTRGETGSRKIHVRQP
jgi:glycerophosphoryl diester phosphodiesterase